MAQSFDSWLNSLGPLTRYALGAVVLLTAGASLRVIPLDYILLFPSAFTELQLWRLLTAAFFFGGFSFPWLLSVAMFVSYLNYNETYDFKGKSGDFLWMGLILILANAVGGLLLGLLVTSFALLMSLCWVFCKRHPELRMNLYNFEFHANTFPWILLVFHLILGQSILEDLLGIVVGHGFFFCRDVLPRTHGIDPLRTPAWFLRYVLPNAGPGGVATLYPASHPQAGRFARPPPDANAGQRHRWGTGRVLGAE
ncbi:Derlin-2/3 [Trypanosoma conorhini]|uniref:Derlin n=1 Tax=Trypanosoma conorhini TaxID=83891 RepID=A0A3R7ND48_9TRYP|nr:Derlin-2/3 [Trypanosoma conorhini]RNF20354.1 Derlin-2/3 [Trypanosoma conorhini]